MDSQRPITYAEHKEFSERMETENKRLADEDRRQNKRIEELEESMRQIGTLAASVEKLATSMENMAKEQEEQRKEIRELEEKDGKRWRNAVETFITSVIGIVVGYILHQFRM